MTPMNNLVQPTQARSVMKMAELIQRGPNRPTAKVAAIVPSRLRLGDLVTREVPVILAFSPLFEASILTFLADNGT